MHSDDSGTIALHELSLHNTGRASPGQVIAAFAARRPLLDRILSDITAEEPNSRPQQHLIVGQRGMGKTMLLARIAAELRTNQQLKEKFVPLGFAEEQYAVDRLSKFWLNCLDSLADSREFEKDTQAVDEIDATVARLNTTKPRPVKQDQAFADEVYAAFAEAVQGAGQRPVLLVDNVQLVFERLERKQQHSLRELLMRPGAPILVGASPSPPPESQDYGAAFYDQFKVHYLRPLDEAEMRDLLVHLAEVVQRDDVRQRVLLHPARLKVLRQLTGGNPRTALTLFFLYAEDFAPSVFGDLEGLLDRVTPLYKARFEELTAQQQVITSSIANHWDPVTGKLLAQDVGLPASTISAQLDRLVQTGTVERVDLFGESSTGYQIAERFFNIWFLMRSASRRQRREVEFLTRFLENFYEPPERIRLADHLKSECGFSADRHLWVQALAGTLHPTDAHDLTRHAELDALHQSEERARRELKSVIDFDSLHPDVLAFADLKKKLEGLVSVDSEVDPESFVESVLGDRKMFESGDRDRLASGKPLSGSEVDKVLGSVVASRTTDELRYGADAVEWLSHRLSKGQLAAPHSKEDWETAFQHANEESLVRILFDTMPDEVAAKLSEEIVERIVENLEPGNSASAVDWSTWAYELTWKLREYSQGAIALQSALNLDDSDPDNWIGLGYCLRRTYRYEEAIAACEEAISRDHGENTIAAGWALIGDIHGDSLQFEKAETAYRRSLSVEEQNGVWKSLAWLLAENFGRYSEAEDAYRKAIEVDDGLAWTWSDLGVLLRDHTSRLGEAETAFKRAIELDGGESWHWLRLGTLYCDFLDRPADALEVLTKVEELDPNKDYAADTLLFLHRDFLGEGGAAEPLLKRLLGFTAATTPDVNDLHRSLFAAYAKNWGVACGHLDKALKHLDGGFGQAARVGWFRASAVFLHLNYGAELIAFLDERGESVRLRPWVEALRALEIGDRRALRNIAPEIRTTAEFFYDAIERRLLQLPKKTCRRPE